MRNIFIIIYDWLERHRKFMYLLLSVLVCLNVVLALQLKFEENIMSFFDDGKKDSAQKEIFENFRLKDKIITVISGSDPDEMIQVAENFSDQLQQLIDEGLIRSVVSGMDESLIQGTVDFFYDHLPIYLTDEDYERIDSSLTEERIRESVDNCYALLTSASGMVVGDVLKRDPLHIGSHLMNWMKRFDSDLDYELYSGYIFNRDMSLLILYIDPVFGMGNTGENSFLIDRLEQAMSRSRTETVDIQCIGGPVIAVCNARQIKRDSILTLGLALLILIPVILLSFRNRRSIPLILLPPLMGGLFALAAVYLIQGSISAIAIGAGTVVLGIALSYSIHVISHSNHTADPRQIIRDLSYPLTVGCLTTIGAFLALLFTSSALLQDMGLFSALTLVGTTLFSLIFLPHFIPKSTPEKKKSKLLNWIERVNGYAYENKKGVVLLILLMTFFCLFFYNDVEFDDDMTHINYMPDDIAVAEAQLQSMVEDESRQIYVVSSDSDGEDTYVRYRTLRRLYDTLKMQGRIEGFTDILDFYIPEQEQLSRIEKWNHFWENRRIPTLERISRYAVQVGFSPQAFQEFESLLHTDYQPCYFTAEEIGTMPVLPEWITVQDSTQTFLSRIDICPGRKEEVYRQIDSLGGHIVIDRAYFSSQMVTHTSDDFNFILLLSSLIVFVALFLSYGRIELTLLTFLPMCISWVIILGLMAVFEVKFNIVNVILATFIFGIGDDFSIFIMDGLMQEYRDGKKLLAAHKTAIFFSAFTTIIGMGVLIFAQHPALKSIAMISVLGLGVVVLVAYTIQPFLFHLLISGQVEKGGFPFTLLTILNSIYAFLYFFLGCIFMQLMLLLLVVFPIRKKTKKRLIHQMICIFSRTLLKSIFTMKVKTVFEEKEDFSRPSVMISNHESFIDILIMLSLTPKLVMVTNSWVWHSPFFGRIIRYIDFQHAADGYEVLAQHLEPLMKDGYSVVIFPEGTRSADCSIQTFRRGAFYLASLLKVDLIPIVLYGPGMISSKKQGFYIKKGIAVARIFRRLSPGDESMGRTYQEQSKVFRKWYVQKYEEMNEKYGRVSNPYFRDALIKNYIYKGPILEWYMRIKCRLDEYYDFWDRMLPRDARITDVGCGYGQLSLMLAMLSRKRHLTGIDYDADKIDLASRSFLCRENVEFIHGDIRQMDLPQSDAFVFNDSLHYMDEENREHLLSRCLDKLENTGIILIRESDCSNQKEYDTVLLAEKWSTRILRFNKVDGHLSFISAAWVENFAARYGLQLQVQSSHDRTEETIFILRKDSSES